ncbi:MAG: hypothetical protein WC728_16060 [Elusimicrobiota bacterium]
MPRNTVTAFPWSRTRSPMQRTLTTPPRAEAAGRALGADLDDPGRHAAREDEHRRRIALEGLIRERVYLEEVQP